MVKTENLSFSYGRKFPPVLDDFSLQFAPGGIYGLLGKNGTGKSTLLYLLCGLLRPQRGTIRVLGQNPADRRPEVLSETFLVPEELELPDVSLDRYVELNAPFYPRFSREMLNECLTDFELQPDLRLGRLSMGQKKKVFVSFALAAQTRLLLMDEPTNGLDIPAKSQFRKVVASHLNQNQTAIISTHQVRDIDTLLDHIVVVDGTKLLLNTSVADITERLAFELRPVGSPTDDALFAQPTLQGVACIVPNDEDRETPLNLELLFNALMQNHNLLN